MPQETEFLASITEAERKLLSKILLYFASSEMIEPEDGAEAQAAEVLYRKIRRD